MMLWDLLVGIWGSFGGGLWDLGADRVNLGCFTVLGVSLDDASESQRVGGYFQEDFEVLPKVLAPLVFLQGFGVPR